MINFMVANMREGNSRYRFDRIELLIKAQIDNSLAVGWDLGNTILLTNFEYEYMGISAIQTELNTDCWTGSKLYGLQWLFQQGIDDVVWAHDLDCWQQIWFDCPEFATDVGACQYSNPKWNGGSNFWRPSSSDIVEEILRRIAEEKAVKEEPLLNKVFKDKKYRDRVTALNSTYNVGCSGFVPRYTRSLKPIRVCHFHPYNQVAWEIHALDRTAIGEIAVTLRLERLLRKYYPQLATELRHKKKRQQGAS